MKKSNVFFCSLSAVLLAAGCASNMGGSTVSRSQAMQPMTVALGTVLEVREVTIEGTATGSSVGAVAGGAMGYALGRGVGGGSGNRMARTAGAIAGSAAGAGVGQAATTQAGLEIMVELDDGGDVVVVVQARDDDFAPGDHVRVIRSADGRMRVRQ